MAKSGKRSWEKLYEQYQNGEMDEKLEKMKLKSEAGKLDREEYKEYEKMIKIKGNISKVKNILELRESLKNEIEKVKQEINAREYLIKLSQKSEELESGLNVILIKQEENESEIKRLNIKLKNKGLSPEEREETKSNLEKAKNERENLRLKVISNNKEFQENNKKLEDGNKNKKEFKNMTTEDLKNLITNKKIKISKCNTVCNNLMKGVSWKNIELKLDQLDERYTGKKEELERLKKAKTATKEEPEDGKIKDAKKSRFGKIMSALRHPIKTFKEWRENKTKALPEVVEEKNDQEAEEKKEPKIDNDFKAYLKAVAEKGMDEVKKEKHEAKKEQLKGMKKESADKYAKKYGGRYNEQDGADRDR